jgi:hypothetical protein
MNATQPELGFHDTPPEAPAVTWLERWLEEHPGWHNAADILRTMGREETDGEKRAIRSVAAASDAIVSGQKGYQHIAHSTPEQINHAANWLESQAGKMHDRAIAIRRRAHAIFG